MIKRAIRRKATMCFVRDGILYIQKKKKKDRVGGQYLKCSVVAMQVLN